MKYQFMLALGLLFIVGTFAQEGGMNMTMPEPEDSGEYDGEEMEKMEKMMKMREKMKGEMKDMMEMMQEKMMDLMDDEELFKKYPCMHAKKVLDMMSQGVEMIEGMMEKGKRKAKNVLGCMEREISCRREDRADRLRGNRGSRSMGRY